MKFKQELIGPKEAQKLLDSNYINQRLVKGGLVDYLVSILREGKWNSNLPQPLMISESGALLDGQHRCRAIVKSGIKALCWIVYDVPESAYPDIDSGVSRTLYDRVTFTPECRKLNKTVAGIVTQWFLYGEGKGCKRPNPGSAQDLFSKHSSAIMWAARSRPHEKGIGRVQVALAMAQMYERNSDKAQALADTVWNNDMKRTNGIRLREFLIAGKAPQGACAGSNWMYSEYAYKTCVGVCRAELEGQALKRLRVASWDE
jgi:hypothetical protein